MATWRLMRAERTEGAAGPAELVWEASSVAEARDWMEHGLIDGDVDTRAPLTRDDPLVVEDPVGGAVALYWLEER